MASDTSQAGRPPISLPNLERIFRDLLREIGEDPEREGLRETPARCARMWRDFIEHDPGNTGTAFSAIDGDQMIVVRGIRVHTFCEHHLLPFDATISVGVICREKVLGLSKFARVARKHAHRLQIQERLVADIAAEVSALAETPDVAVVADGVHLCMTMRGVRAEEARMLCSALHGRFKHAPETRAEFFRLVGY